MKKIFGGILALALILTVAGMVLAENVTVGGRLIQEQKGGYNQIPEIQISISARGEINALSSLRGYLYLVLEYPDGREIFLLPNARNFNNFLSELYQWKTVGHLPLSEQGTYTLKVVFSQREIFGFYFGLNDLYLYLNADNVEYLKPGSYNFIVCEQIPLLTMSTLDLPSCPLPGAEKERVWHIYFPDGTSAPVSQSQMIWLILH